MCCPAKPGKAMLHACRAHTCTLPDSEQDAGHTLNHYHPFNNHSFIRSSMFQDKMQNMHSVATTILTTIPPCSMTNAEYALDRYHYSNQPFLHVSPALCCCPLAQGPVDSAPRC
eukprot:scaffold173066_cov21-Tisochrysis_lutea.AAC.2